MLIYIFYLIGQVNGFRHSFQNGNMTCVEIFEKEDYVSECSPVYPQQCSAFKRLSIDVSTFWKGGEVLLGEETVKDKVYECMVNSSVEWDDFTCQLPELLFSSFNVECINIKTVKWSFDPPIFLYQSEYIYICVFPLPQTWHLHKLVTLVRSSTCPPVYAIPQKYLYPAIDAVSSTIPKCCFVEMLVFSQHLPMTMHSNVSMSKRILPRDNVMTYILYLTEDNVQLLITVIEGGNQLQSVDQSFSPANYIL